MAQEDLPEDLKKLIADHIVSVEQVEILLLLRRRASEEWSPRAVSDEIRTSERSAATRLADLRARGFLTSRDAGSQMYRYEPATAWLRRAVDQLAEAYAERRFTVINLIFSKPIDNLRVYADAFRFRKDDSDG